jgi:hypothetical protein
MHLLPDLFDQDFAVERPVIARFFFAELPWSDRYRTQPLELWRGGKRCVSNQYIN